jgi:hypothetical protein
LKTYGEGRASKWMGRLHLQRSIRSQVAPGPKIRKQLH